jgi:DNA replication protein DnaC
VNKNKNQIVFFFLVKNIGDVPTAGAILDRLLQHAEIIPFKGKSYRLSNRKKDKTAIVFENS